MSEITATPSAIQETEFSKALDAIESSDLERRREGVARLERIGGNKAFQVATVLLGDADQVVSSTARRICAKFKGSGLNWGAMHNSVKPAEKHNLSSIWLILDEVIFICRKNLSELAYASFIAALPKLFFVFFIFAGPFLIPDFSGYLIFPFILFLVAFHQIFWRPFAWLTIGKAFLGGFPDRMTRQSANQAIKKGKHFTIFWVNAISALPYALLLSFSFNYFVSYSSELIFFAGWFVFWLFFWELLFFCNPLVLLKDSFPGVLAAINLRFLPHVKIFRQNTSVLAVSAFLYLMIYLSSSLSMVFLGVDFNSGRSHVSSALYYFSFWVTADCFVDPFLIGYRILMTKLLAERVNQ